MCRCFVGLRAELVAMIRHRAWLAQDAVAPHPQPPAEVEVLVEEQVDAEARPGGAMPGRGAAAAAVTSRTKAGRRRPMAEAGVIARGCPRSSPRCRGRSARAPGLRPRSRRRLPQQRDARTSRPPGPVRGRTPACRPRASAAPWLQAGRSRRSRRCGRAARPRRPRPRPTSRRPTRCRSRSSRASIRPVARSRRGTARGCPARCS